MKFGRTAIQGFSKFFASLSAEPTRLGAFRVFSRIVRVDHFAQPSPTRLFSWPGGLLDRDRQLRDLALDLFARQNMEAARENRRFDHSGLRAIEAMVRGVRDMPHDLAMKPWPQLILGDSDNPQRDMRQAIGKTRSRAFLARNRRPISPSGETTGKDPYVVGVVRHSERYNTQIVEGSRGAKRRDDHLFTILDQAERRDVNAPVAVDRRHDRFADHRQRLILRGGAQRVPRLFQSREIFRIARAGDAPVERFILRVTLAEPPGCLRLGQFRAEIKSVRGVCPDIQSREKRKGVSRDVMPRAIIDMEAIFGGFDPKIQIFHLGRQFGDFIGRIWKRLSIVQLQQRSRIVSRQAGIFARRIKNSPRNVMLLDGAPRMWTDLYREDIAYAQFGTHAEQHRGHASRIGVCQFGKIARSHEDFRIRQPSAQFDIARQRRRKAEMDGIEDWVQNTGDPEARGAFGELRQGVEIAVLGRDQYRGCARFEGEVEPILLEAQEKIGAGASAAREFVPLGGIDADAKADAFQRLYAVFKMSEGRVRQAPEVDHIGAGGRHRRGLSDDFVDGKRRGVHDLGENANVVSTQVHLPSAPAKIGGKVLQLIGAPDERYAELFGQSAKVRPATAGDDHARGGERPWQASGDNRLRHQRRDLYADVDDRPIKIGLLQAV